jgi:hypothetical protein
MSLNEQTADKLKMRVALMVCTRKADRHRSLCSDKSHKLSFEVGDTLDSFEISSLCNLVLGLKLHFCYQLVVGCANVTAVRLSECWPCYFRPIARNGKT